MKRISPKSLPVRLPIFASITAWLLMDRLQAPGWVYGAVGLYFVVWWIAAVIALHKEQWLEVADSAFKR